MTAPALHRLLAFAIPVFVACQSNDVVAIGTTSSGADAGGSAGAVAGQGARGGMPGEPVGGRGGTSSLDCVVPVVSLVDFDGAAVDVCTARLAARTFTHAACTCADVDFVGDLNSVGFDSLAGVESTPGGASVGINGTCARVDSIRVDGSLKVASAAAVLAAGDMRIGGDLWLAGSTTVAGVLRVERDAWFAQSSSSVGVATIGRDLHTAPGATLTSIGVAQVSGTTTSEPFTIAEPCACNPDRALDIAVLIGSARTANDNPVSGLESAALVAGGPTDITLPCGRFYLQAIGGGGAVRVNVTGRVALFVDGDVQTTSEFVLELGGNAELDWFIRGNLTIDPGALLGDPNRPAATRIYVQGDREIALPGTARAAFNLYAPRAQVTIGGEGAVHGSVFARSLSAEPDVVVNYDRAVLRAGETCPAPGSACEPCAQCSAGARCLSNACFACNVDGDCCAPFTCAAGTCQPLIAN